MTFTGKMTLDGATLAVDLGNGDKDFVVVNTSGAGATNMVTLNGLNTVKANVLGVAGPGYLVMQADDGFIGSGGEIDADGLLAYFNSLGGSVRQSGGTLRFDNLNAGGYYTELWIDGVTGGKNAKIYWSGTFSNLWDRDTNHDETTGTKNWSDKTTDLTFYDYDYVLFNDSPAAGGVNVTEYDIDVTGDWSVVGMDIERGTYSFFGSGTIDGVTGQGTLDVADQTGQLRFLGG
ncbi:MAG TPA: hypothetical protein DEB39_02620, partial [Planctomycetaceae bacterium]|nr:hypothetical protein [Planctomycetaceae bacterium]